MGLFDFFNPRKKSAGFSDEARDESAFTRRMNATLRELDNRIKERELMAKIKHRKAILHELEDDEEEEDDENGFDFSNIGQLAQLAANFTQPAPKQANENPQTTTAEDLIEEFEAMPKKEQEKIRAMVAAGSAR